MEKSLWSREAPEVYSRPEKRHRALLVVLVLLLTFTASPSAQDKDQGATRYAQFSLFYNYRSLPENRPALRKYMDTAGAAQFEKWKSEGVFKDYMINVGETLAASGMGSRDAAKAIYDVSYYRFKVPLDAGKDFIQGYVMPQLNAFMREKVFAGYGLYLNRYESTDWSYLILSEYADATAFDLRVSNKSKIRSLLDPAWKTLHDIKTEHIRDEPHGFIAVRIVPR